MITIIVAQDEQGAIGKDNDLPWPRIKEDMKFFRDTTMGKVVIMGRKTFESLPKREPLAGRLNIVLSSSYNGDDAEPTYIGNTQTAISLVDSLEKAFAIADEHTPDDQDTFIIGGAEIYNASLRYADRILLTRVVGTYEADVFLNLGLGEWELESSQSIERDGELICTFGSYKRAGSPTEATTE